MSGYLIVQIRREALEEAIKRSRKGTNIIFEINYDMKAHMDRDEDRRDLLRLINKSPLCGGEEPIDLGELDHPLKDFREWIYHKGRFDGLDIKAHDVLRAHYSSQGDSVPLSFLLNNPKELWRARGCGKKTFARIKDLLFDYAEGYRK